MRFPPALEGAAPTTCDRPPYTRQPRFTAAGRTLGTNFRVPFSTKIPSDSARGQGPRMLRWRRGARLNVL